jgi:hypothetical protein
MLGLRLPALACLLARELLPGAVRRLLIGTAGRRGGFFLAPLGVGIPRQCGRSQQRSSRNSAGENEMDTPHQYLLFVFEEAACCEKL